MTMVERLPEIAERLLREGGQSSMSRRRAVSTAYYALFHSLAKLSADALVGPAKLRTIEYEGVYRGLDHGPMKKAFNTLSQEKNQRIAKIEKIVITLQSERHKSDYLPPTPGLYSRSECKELVARAKSAVEELAELSDGERLLLATSLLFKDRVQ